MSRITFVVLLFVGLVAAAYISVDQTFGCTLSAWVKDCRPCLRTGSKEGNEIVNKWANVTDLTLDKTEVRIPPTIEGEPPPGEDHSRDMLVEVNTKAEDPEGDILTYHYTVSGGRIVGQGAHVYWDLTGTQPGTYSITAAVDDGCGLCGRRTTQTVNVIETTPK